jgi:hypothetical protein
MTSPVTAAAPDLLTALKIAVETIKIWHGGPGLAWARYQASPEMRLIAAAIKNAEGR